MSRSRTAHTYTTELRSSVSWCVVSKEEGRRQDTKQMSLIPASPLFAANPEAGP